MRFERLPSPPSSAAEILSRWTSPVKASFKAATSKTKKNQMHRYSSAGYGNRSPYVPAYSSADICINIDTEDPIVNLAPHIFT